MSTTRVGRDREYAVMRHLEQHGWRKVMRAAGSKGSADCLMVHAVHGPALIQVGGTHKTLGPAERARLIADADDCGALALLATPIPRHGITYWQITNGTPSTWPRWTP